MNRKIYSAILFLIAAGVLAAYLLKPVKNTMVISNNIPVQPVYHPTIIAAVTSPVAKPVVRQIERDANSLSVTRRIPENAPAQDENESADFEKYRLLRRLRDWAAKDPEAALAAATKLPAGDERNQALAAVCFGLAETDPADAVKTAQSLHLDNQPGAVIENLVQQWSSADLSSALDWVNNQAAGEDRDNLMTRVVYVMSQSNPVNAANLAINQISAGPTQDEAVMSVVNQWGNQDLTAAAVWVKEFPDGQLQERAIKELEGISNRQLAIGAAK